MGERTRVALGRRDDLGADCDNCFGLCCVALAFAKSADFPFDKPAGDPCVNLDAHDGCRIHPQLRDRGFKGCTVFDCFGAGQKISQRTFAGRSWRDDPEVRMRMFASFPIMRRLHELLWYLDEAISLVTPLAPSAEWVVEFERVRALTEESAETLTSLDVDAQFDASRALLVRASELARKGFVIASASTPKPKRARKLQPGSDLMGVDLAGADLRGRTLRGSILIAADLSGADLELCDLLGVDLRDADLSGANLDGAIFLTQMQVNSARGDDATRLPHGFERPTHWAGRLA
ncbi:pentapeptide repeat-containing protein [Amnibacterium flavum]|uniref:Pentapeptide repeat-containing protein n=1 Tax=Amnibacterium flavum TaxID=2173173 RepID=A0A2V1HTP1_9MICO|nr:pentapeptide repeat-containing protein [Amnibacterium flavum]PVZ93464.1 hypothetical protein DDQ50_16005 [Amnibacterium flavum]